MYWYDRQWVAIIDIRCFLLTPQSLNHSPKCAYWKYGLFSEAHICDASSTWVNITLTSLSNLKWYFKLSSEQSPVSPIIRNRHRLSYSYKAMWTSPMLHFNLLVHLIFSMLCRVNLSRDMIDNAGGDLYATNIIWFDIFFIYFIVIYVHNN